MEQLRLILANPFLVDTVSMSTASECSIKLFDRGENKPDTANKWVELEIKNGELYVNKTGPVHELECISNGCRFELIFKCRDSQNLKILVSLLGLEVKDKYGIKTGTCVGYLELIEWLKENWTRKYIRESDPPTSARG